MISSSSASTSNDIDSVSSVPQLFQQLVLSSLPEDGSCVDKSLLLQTIRQACSDDKQLRDRYLEILARNFVIGKFFVAPSTYLLFRVTEIGPKHRDAGVVISGVPPHYSWNVPTAPSASDVLNRGPPRADDPAFRKIVFDTFLKQADSATTPLDESQVYNALVSAKWFNREERVNSLQKMIDEGVVERRETKLALLQRSEQSPKLEQKTGSDLRAAILSLLPKDGSCMNSSTVTEKLISQGWKDKHQRARCIDFLVESFLIGKAIIPPTATHLFMVTEFGPKLPPYTVVISKIPPQYAASWIHVPTAPDAASSQDMSPPRTDEQNFVSDVLTCIVLFISQGAGRIQELRLITRLINPKGWCNRQQRDRLLQKMIDEKLIGATVGEIGSREIFKLNSDDRKIGEIQQPKRQHDEAPCITALQSSSSNIPSSDHPNANVAPSLPASLKTATKLYFENIKDLVPSEGLEKSSVMVLMGHQHGWKDQNMQQEFLDELSSKGLVQLRSDPANPGLIKLFCTSPSEQHQQQPPSIANGPQRRTRSPDVTPNVNSSNTGSYYSQHQPREVVHILPIFAGKSPLAVPPPQLVRNGQPVNRTNLSVLMKMPPPFKVERSYYY